MVDIIEPNAVAVFTARSPERIIEEGGSRAWVLNPARAKLCDWLVCAQNRHNPDHEFSDATKPHGAGFLIGRISRLSPAADAPGRWTIEIDEYARIDRPGLWAGWRNPVRYTTLDELGIDLEDLTLEKMPSRDRAATAVPQVLASAETAGLTIALAKAGLAATYGVQPEAIEIIIRG